MEKATAWKSAFTAQGDKFTIHLFTHRVIKGRIPFIMSAKERLKGRMTKDSVTLLPCFYFVEVSESSSRHIDRDVSYALCLINRRELGVWWSSFTRWSRSKSVHSPWLLVNFTSAYAVMVKRRTKYIALVVCHVNVKGIGYVGGKYIEQLFDGFCASSLACFLMSAIQKHSFPNCKVHSLA